MLFKIKFRALVAAVGISVVAVAGFLPTLAGADDKPRAGVVELIVPFGPASGANQVARESAKLLIGVLPAEIKITNVLGATGNTGIAKLLASPSDGNTMAVLTGDTFSLLAYLNPGWKLSDIVPLAVMIKQPSALFFCLRTAVSRLGPSLKKRHDSSLTPCASPSPDWGAQTI